MHIKQGKNIAGWVLFLLIAYFPLFLHLDHQPIHNYDEGRLSVSAYEMSQGGNVLIPTLGGEPDMWSVKPPFVIWLQAISINVLGVNELAVRLPVALFGLFSVLLVAFWGQKYLGDGLWGFLAGIILLTAPGFVGFHVTRTADYDAVVCFWLLLQLFSLHQYIESLEEGTPQVKWLYVTGGAVALGVLSKSIVGLMFVPGLILAVVLLGKFRHFLKNPHTYGAILSAIIPILAYYLGREAANPGYIQAVMEQELLGRYQVPQETHSGDGWYYLELLEKEAFSYWIWGFPLGIWAFFQAKKPIKRVLTLAICTSVIFLIGISTAATKLPWYSAPLFPPLALIIALGASTLVYPLLSKTSSTRSQLGVLALIVFISAGPYSNMLRSSYKPGQIFQKYFHDSRYGYVMRKMEPFYPFLLPNGGYNAHMTFYQVMWEKKNMPLERRVIADLQVGDQMLICEEHLLTQLKSDFEFEVLYEAFPCQLVEIRGRN